MTLSEQILSQIPGNPLKVLGQTDQRWQMIKMGRTSIPMVVTTQSGCLGDLDWDVVVAGGTLGILVGAVLAQKGWRVALLERGTLRGRDQEWNISRRELSVLIELGLLTEVELEQAIASEYNPGRIAFGEGPEFWVRDVLNVGVDPVYLLATLKQRFIAAGGKLLENTAFQGAIVHPDGVEVKAGSRLKTRLLLDVMGHFSPIVQQARQGQTPDGVCLVVGSCAQGFAHNDTGDLFVSFTPTQNHCQYFWEAFPARDGRTTYLFTYLTVHPERPRLADLLADYFHLLPDYQNIDLDQLQWQRFLFGLLPAYRSSPLQPAWDRILQVGDSSGAQSPLSFGGFGAMLRHLDRLTQALETALKVDALDRPSLGFIQPYQPNLAVTWLFQRTMSIAMDQRVDPNQINQLLATVFQEMNQLGDSALQPFLQDVVQFSILSQILIPLGLKHPQLIGKILPQAGVLGLVDWTYHYLNLGGYTVLSKLGRSLELWLKHLSPQQQHIWRCRLQGWRYGAGLDYGGHH